MELDLDRVLASIAKQKTARSYMSNAKQISRIGEKSSYRYWKP